MMDSFFDNLTLEGAERQIGVWHRNVSLIVHSVIGVTHLSALLIFRYLNCLLQYSISLFLDFLRQIVNSNI